MQFDEQPAELVNQPRPRYGPESIDPAYIQEEMGGEPEQENPMFSHPNDLRVIQEYNREENMPNEVKSTFWALTSKSIKLGFWKEEDAQDIFLHKNIIKVGHIMSQPKHKYTFSDRLNMHQVDMLVYADFKRGIGMEKYRINERVLQSAMISQRILGSGQSGQGKKGGVFSGLKSFFG